MNLRSLTQWHPILWLTNRPKLLASAVFAMGLLLSWYAGELQRQRQLSDQKAWVQSELANFRSEIEKGLYVNLALVRSLSTDLVLHGDMSASDLAIISKELERSSPFQKSIALAPNFIIEHIHPLEGNEEAVGLNLLQDENQKKTMYRAIQLDDAVLAGPLELKQGGKAVVLRLPVWIKYEGVPRLWGAVSSAMDLDALMAASGYQKTSAQLNIVIRGVDAGGPAGEAFLGNDIEVSKDAVRMPIFVPGGSWLMSAEPKAGYSAKPWWQNSAGIFGLILSLILASAIYRMLHDRARIRHLANHDPLTMLGNRRKAMSDLKDLSSRSAHKAESFALLSIDLDGFKPINDRFGHEMGDEVLVCVAARLKACVRESDHVARLGGDEFLVMIANIDPRDREFLLKYAQRLRAALQAPIALSDAAQPVHLDASIGIAAYPLSANKIEDLMDVADQAMYRAKREKNHRIEFANDVSELMP
jgi:diguanylate cyclase (GGDEF)-like protein